MIVSYIFDNVNISSDGTPLHTNAVKTSMPACLMVLSNQFAHLMVLVNQFSFLMVLVNQFARLMVLLNQYTRLIVLVNTNIVQTDERVCGYRLSVLMRSMFSVLIYKHIHRYFVFLLTLWRDMTVSALRMLSTHIFMYFSAFD